MVLRSENLIIRMKNQRETTRSVGRRGENFVCEQLRARGFHIIDRNVHERFAEIDIVAEDGDTLCFIEVRTRRHTRFGHPEETVSPSKQQSIRRAAEAFLTRRETNHLAIRFDVATVVWDTLAFCYYEDAF